MIALFVFGLLFGLGLLIVVMALASKAARPVRSAFVNLFAAAAMAVIVLIAVGPLVAIAAAIVR